MTTIAVLDHRDPSVAEQIVAVERAGYRVEAELTGYDGMEGLHEEPEDVIDLDLVLLGAFEGDQLVGVLGYRRHGSLVDVHRLAVHPERFRRGIGRSLLEALHEREGDARRIEVTTSTGNTPAISLYLRSGYVISGRDDSSEVPVSHFARAREEAPLTPP